MIEISYKTDAASKYTVADNPVANAPLNSSECDMLKEANSPFDDVCVAGLRKNVYRPGICD